MFAFQVNCESTAIGRQAVVNFEQKMASGFVLDSIKATYKAEGFGNQKDKDGVFYKDAIITLDQSNTWIKATDKSGAVKVLASAVLLVAIAIVSLLM
jgi:hypothetical protein